MSNEDYGDLAFELIDCLRKLLCSLRIKVADGLIKYQNIRLP
jgi:hypothetical protein